MENLLYTNAHVYENLISIFATDLLDQNLTSFYIPK